MMASNGLRAAVPAIRPLFGSTIARSAAMAARSSGLTGCVTDQGSVQLLHGELFDI